MSTKQEVLRVIWDALDEAARFWHNDPEGPDLTTFLGDQVYDALERNNLLAASPAVTAAEDETQAER